MDDLASGIVDRGDEIAAYITSKGCRRAGLRTAQEREWAAQAAAAANSAAIAALQAATTACSRAELEARLLRDELAAADGAVAALLEREAASSTHGRRGTDVDWIELSIAEAVVAEALLVGEQTAKQTVAKEAAARQAIESLLRAEAAAADTAERLVHQLCRDADITAGLLRHA